MAKCCVYDLSISATKITPENLIKLFDEHCKKWCFQTELGEKTGYLHYQCRISLKVKAPISKTEKLFSCVKAHVTPTSSQNLGNDFYASKEDTRVAGPWRNTDEKPAYIQKRFRGEIQFSEMQQYIINDIMGEPDDRTVNVIYDTLGKKGKSWLAAYCAQHGLARYLPSLNDYAEICEFAMSFPPAKAYFLDMPRGLPKKHLNGIYAGLENLKNGYLFDKRYHGKEKWIEPPHIWVFTNVLPDKNLLSADRWNLWTIKAGALVSFSYEDLEASKAL